MEKMILSLCCVLFIQKNKSKKTFIHKKLVYIANKNTHVKIVPYVNTNVIEMEGKILHPSRQIVIESQKNNVRATFWDVALMLFCWLSNRFCPLENFIEFWNKERYWWQITVSKLFDQKLTIRSNLKLYSPAYLSSIPPYLPSYVSFSQKMKCMEGG